LATDRERLNQLRAQKTKKPDRARLEELRALKRGSGVEESAAEAFTISVGRGTAKAVRGIENLFNIATGSDTDALTSALNIGTAKEEREAFAPLEEKHPVATTLGEITGEIAATVPLGMGAGRVALAGTQAVKGGALATRFAPVVAAGVTEGGIIGAGEDQALEGAIVGGVAATAAEALLPPIARRLKRFFGKAKPLDELITVADGKVSPTAETLEVLEEVGVSFDDIAEEAQKELLNPAQAATKAAFAKEGVEPASRTRIRPNVKDIQSEGFLLRQTDSQAADEFRERVVAENEAIKGRFQAIADDLGVTGEEGSEKLKSALFGIKSNMRSARNQAYQDLAEVAQQKPELVGRIPLNKDRLVDGVREVSELGIDDSTSNAVVRAFEDFGLVEKAERKGGLSLITGDAPIEDLTIANLNKFRQRINRTFDVTNPKEALARKSVINAIDEIELEVVEAFEGSTLEVPKLIQNAAKRARQSVIDEKRVFSSSDLIEQLVKPKRSGLNAVEAPLVASSKVFNKITTKATPVEDVRKLIGTLQSEGSEESLEAIGNLQASTMLDLLDSAVQPSRKLVDPSGSKVDVISGTRLNNRIKAIGQDKINAIFKGNKEALNSLKRLRKITEATITPEEAIQKGSIPPDVLNKAFGAVSRAKGIPVVGGIGEFTAERQAGAAKRQITKAGPTKADLIDFVILEDSPRLKKLLEASGQLTPSAAAVTASDVATER